MIHENYSRNDVLLRFKSAVILYILKLLYIRIINPKILPNLSFKAFSLIVFKLFSIIYPRVIKNFEKHHENET